MAISVVFDPPVPANDPATFNNKAFATLGDLNAWSGQANALALEVSQDEAALAAAVSSASGSATTATTKAGEAATSATNASTSATNASTSATNAATSATTATTQATNAAGSATAAAASAASIAGGPVTSVNAKTGVVVLTKSDIGLGSVDNTSDADKPVSTAQATAIGAKQDTLVSGTNIKTINSTSLLGSGNIVAGDVTGQASSIDNEIALFSGTGGKTIKRATTTGLLKATSGVLAEATAGTDYVAPGTATTFTATQTFMGIGETQYNLTGTDLSVSNGTIQYKTLTVNTTFTESLADGQSVVLMLNPSTFTTTWPTLTWIKPEGATWTAPPLKASAYNALTFFQFGGVLYGRFDGSV